MMTARSPLLPSSTSLAVPAPAPAPERCCSRNDRLLARTRPAHMCIYICVHPSVFGGFGGGFSNSRSRLTTETANCLHKMGGSRGCA